MEQVIESFLLKDGWEITDDPYIMKFGEEDEEEKLKVDFGAVKIIAAKKENQKIAVEVKSFLNESVMYDYHSALGQMMNYQIGIDETEKDRLLFLAMPDEAYKKLKTKFIFRKSVEKNNLKIIIVDVDSRKIVTWKK